MDRRQFLSAAAGGFMRRAYAGSRPPNIIWIMADDLGYADLGCYGQKYIRTPNIDRMAAEGMQFSDAYAGCSVCAPSRSTLMTGLHAGHTSVRSNRAGVPMLASDFTVAQMLKSAGYATGGFGKWGLGDLGSSGVPNKHGFDHFFGYLNQVHAHFHYPPYLIDDEKKFPLRGNDRGKRTTYAHDVIAARALDFIRTNANRPFFCYVPFTLPHLAMLVPEDSMREYLGKIPEGKPFVDQEKHYADQPHLRATYAGMVSRLDRDVGRILALLKELKLESNTIVFFCSDNGVSSHICEDNFFEVCGSDSGPTAELIRTPLRDAKESMYEGGLRVPMIARWPGRIPGGSRSNLPWYFPDFFATAAELSGGRLPSGLDGLSLVPTLLHRGLQERHEFMYWELPIYIPKTGTFAEGLPSQGVRMGDWKAVRHYTRQPILRFRSIPNVPSTMELYDLKSDIGERKNVAAQNPGIVARIEKYLQTARVEPRPQKEPSGLEYHLRDTE